MPTAPKRYSPHGQGRRQHDGNRLNSYQRGYDKHWAKLRKAFLSENPLCKKCMEQGNVTPAEEVDHIIPFKSKHDPLRMDWRNLCAYCKRHHSQKTREDMKAGRTRQAGR